MTFRGHFDKGMIRPVEPVNLPDGTEVSFNVKRKPGRAARKATAGGQGRGRFPSSRKAANPDRPSWVDVVLKFAGTVDDLPSDFAENHDHYIHGAPKRKRR